MKPLLTVFLLLRLAYGQKYDTTQMFLQVADTTSFYYIYDSKGKIVANETSLKRWSIPSGGWATRDRFINPYPMLMVGFVVYRNDTITGPSGYPMIDRREVKVLNSNKQELQKPYIYTKYYFPVDGWQRK